MNKVAIKFSISPAEMNEREHFSVAQNLPDVRKYREGKRQAFARELELHTLFSLLSLHHFGAERSVESSDILDLAVSLGIEFFEGDWWTQHKRDVVQLSREEGNEDLQWFEPFRLSFLFASLVNHKRLLQTLGQWPESWMQAEWRATPFPDGIEQLYFLLLTRFGLGDIASETAGIGDARIKSLYEAIAKPRNGRLGAALNESLQRFAMTLKGKEVLPYEAIAIEETIIVALWRVYESTDLASEVEPKFHQLLLFPEAIKGARTL